MSLIDRKPGQKNYGYKSFRTSIKVIVHSHNSGQRNKVENPIIIKEDVFSFSSNKSLKGPGTCNINLTPRINYMNVVYPNDYINVYIDRADGEGWTRVFFGFVDRVTENATVDGTGKPKTIITLSCTDFAKIFDRTNIYFNPNLAKRKEFEGSFIGALNLGGVALRTSGVSASGSPPDIILNCIFVMMGAGGQFILPTGYEPRTQTEFRRKRAEFAIKRLEQDIRLSVTPATLKRFAKRQLENITGASLPDDVVKDIETKQLLEPVRTNSLDLESIDSLSEQTRGSLVSAVLEDSDALNGLRISNTNRRAETIAVLQTALEGTNLSFLDILDVFTFVEREAIDGYVMSVPIWQKQGSLMSFLRSSSNEAINEMFFDLRAASEDDSKGLVAGDFSRTADEIGGNLDEGGTKTPGVRYIPSLIMREYPFSTINGVDGSEIKIKLEDPVTGQQLTLDEMTMGKIFNDRPNEPGRHVIEVPNINIEDRVTGASKKRRARKHLDVAVIQSEDVVSYSWGRSDNDHFNLMEFTSDSFLGSAAKFFMQDIIPIITPIHLARHGLRVRSVSSKFARFGDFTKPNQGPSGGLIVKNPTPDPPKAEPTGLVLLPHGSFPPTGNSPYGYRIKNPGDEQLTFHHGVDIYAPVGTPIQASVDGEVVACARSGVLDGYGNCVIIKHNDKYQGKTVFSLYAHLNDIDSAISDNVNKGWRNNKDRATSVSSKMESGGKMSSLPISAGTIVGTVGTSYGTKDEPDRVFANAKAHLHFEVTTKYPSRGRNPGNPPPVDPADEPAEIPSGLRSFDPKEFFETQGSPGNTDVFGASTIVEDNSDDDKNPEDRDGANPPRDDGSQKQAAPESKASTPKRNNADNRATRIQLARWSLLNDHWYQHNLEYLSGTIQLHGAPEVRVGYRLDFEDKRLSFYVEGVQHQWAFPGKMVTTLSVTRGQPNNPYPMYVLPAIEGFNNTDTQRQTQSRLSEFFIYKDSLATQRGTSFNRSERVNTQGQQNLGNVNGLADNGNITDTADYNEVAIKDSADNFDTPETILVDGRTSREQGLPSVDDLLDDSIDLGENSNTSSVFGHNTGDK